jgi:hypothetical protein
MQWNGFGQDARGFWLRQLDLDSFSPSQLESGLSWLAVYEHVMLMNPFLYL